MEPISAAIAGLAFGMQLFGAAEKYQGAQAQAQTQQQMIGVEKDENALRQQMMNLSAKREQMQVLRNVQRARSLALSNTVSSGAQFGSVLGGSTGQISGQGSTNSVKIAQDTEAGNMMFDFQNRMLGLKQLYAQQGGQINLGSGLEGLGKTFGQVAENKAVTSGIYNVLYPPKA